MITALPKSCGHDLLLTLIITFQQNICLKKAVFALFFIPSMTTKIFFDLTFDMFCSQGQAP